MKSKEYKTNKNDILHLSLSKDEEFLIIRFPKLTQSSFYFKISLNIFDIELMIENNQFCEILNSSEIYEFVIDFLRLNK